MSQATTPTLFERIDLYLMISTVFMMAIVFFSVSSSTEIGLNIIALAIMITGLLIIAITGRRYSQLMKKQDKILALLEKRL